MNKILYILLIMILTTTQSWSQTIDSLANYSEEAKDTFRLADLVNSYREKALAGDAQSQYNLGLCYQYGEGVEKDQAQAIEWFLKAAAQNHAASQCSLGLCYQYEYGIKKDMRQALKWYDKAAR
ncbi:MAG: sel1 repeat family protein, partial [Prevotella sp.]|nr:sel1 repeat family protein [Prevotella sp.]